MNQSRLPKFLYTRPSIINLLHKLYLIDAVTQMTDEEVNCLAKYSSGRFNALEIGSYMGMSSIVILKNLANDGKLTCIDPWPKKNKTENPLYKIFIRQINRTGFSERIKIIRDFSTSVNLPLDNDYDFIFIDGDHSYEGLKNDWDIVHKSLVPGGFVFLHDVIVPEQEPYRKTGASIYFYDNIINDNKFKILEKRYSSCILKKERTIESK